MKLNMATFFFLLLEFRTDTEVVQCSIGNQGNGKKFCLKLSNNETFQKENLVFYFLFYGLSHLGKNKNGKSG